MLVPVDWQTDRPQKLSRKRTRYNAGRLTWGVEYGDEASQGAGFLYAPVCLVPGFPYLRRPAGLPGLRRGPQRTRFR